MIAAQAMLAGADIAAQIITSAVIFVATAVAVFMAAEPVWALLRHQRGLFESVLRAKLLIDVTVRTATIAWVLGAAALVLLGFAAAGMVGAVMGAIVGALLPMIVIRAAHHHRLARLETQLVGGISMLASGVRAGLNLVQSMELIARDGPVPMRQEFAHLVREYEYGVPLEEAMDKAAERIGSSDYRLLFAALQTHRQRGGNLGATLDQIAASIREIQRLENQVKTLTAEGRVTARWLGAMPVVVLAIMYFLVDSAGVSGMFDDLVGQLVIAGIVILNVVGFLWIRKIVAIDI